MEQVTEPSAVTLGVKVANMRTTWIALMALLLQRGLLTVEDAEELRDGCLEVAEEFAASGSALKAEFGQSCVEDLASMFRGILPRNRTEH